MVVHKAADVVDDARDGHECPAVVALGGLGNKVLPVYHGELLERSAPIQRRTLLVELLLQLLETTLVDLVLAELLQV